MGRQVIHLLTDDGLALGEDGAAWQPVEQLASLRAMPNVAVFRPADGTEMMECWQLALHRTGGPSLIAFSSHVPPDMRDKVRLPGAPAGPVLFGNGCARGGYVLAEPPDGGIREVTLIATGPETMIAIAARERLMRHGVAAAVVSLPCWELFSAQTASYREAILGSAPRIGIEAASGFGWERWLGPDGVFIGIDDFGVSAPADELYRQFGITPEAVAERVRRRLGIRPWPPGHLHQ
jgi:transketolase